MEKNPPAGRAGKTTKYFKYAIGEIILVVIGILIALSINNWNENRKALIKENALYSRIVSDLKVDKDKLNVVLDSMKSFQGTQFHIFKESIGEAVFDKNTYYESLRWGERFNPIVKENHNITISTISNEGVREELNQYFKLEERTKEAIAFSNTKRRGDLRAFLTKNGILNTKAIYSVKGYEFEPFFELKFINYENLKNQYGNVELDQILAELRIDTAWAITNILGLIEANEKLKKILEEKITKA
tara:strand:+ start:2560 stop:3294 length:735 start_codon:yes stop_codon:yes gene_type:complete